MKAYGSAVLIACLSVSVVTSCDQDSRAVAEHARTKVTGHPSHLSYRQYTLAMSAESAGALIKDKTCGEFPDLMCIGETIDPAKGITVQGVVKLEDGRVSRWSVDRLLQSPLSPQQISSVFEEQWGKPVDRDSLPTRCAPLGIGLGVLTVTPIGTWRTNEETARVYVMRSVHPDSGTYGQLRVVISYSTADECEARDSTAALVRKIRP